MERRRFIKDGLIVVGGTAATIGVVDYVSEFIKLTNEVFKPRVVYKGNPAPQMDEKPEWVRPTEWRRTIIIEGKK